MELKIEHITKTFGNVTALDDVSVTFVPGIYGILGVNGAGKSTLIHLITDNVSRGQGSICLDGEDILSLGKAFRHKVGFLPQEQGFYGYMSAKSFLRYMASVKEIPAGEAKKEVEQLLRVVGLDRVAHRRIGGFSGGMRQRVMLAQALLGDPDILILDEPTAGLDPKERVNLRNFVSELSKEKIILWTTHVVSDIESIADQVIVMDSGRILLQAPPTELIAAVAKQTGKEITTLEQAFLTLVTEK